MLAHAGLHRSLANNQQRCAHLPVNNCALGQVQSRRHAAGIRLLEGFKGFLCVCDCSARRLPLRRYQRLLADAEQKVFRVLPAFETDNLDRAYDVAEGAQCLPVKGRTIMRGRP